jgi:bacteriocin biosynthesis cyclodehydratase domain-containing protein
MSTLQSRKPRLPSHYYVWFEPPDDSGDEVLHFASERTRIKIKGHSFREFQQSVVPLLDGRHTLEEIERAVAHLFAPQDLEQCLELLAAQNLLEDDLNSQELSLPAAEALVPQLNFLHEVGANPEEVQRRLSRATVTVLGLGGAGAQAAISLAAARVGCVRCVDSSPVTAPDTYLSPFFSLTQVGTLRAPVVAQRIQACAPETKVTVHTQPPEDDPDVLAAIDGSDFVICCLDRGQSSLIYKLNRACLKAGIRWTSCALSGAEVVLGPTVHPFETACYLCYKMRAVACAGNPEDEFAYERFLDRRKQDDGGRLENLVFGAGLLANWLGLEAMKELSGIAEPASLGGIIAFDLLAFTCTRHVVLRKPWCPACFKAEPASQPGSKCDGN